MSAAQQTASTTTWTEPPWSGWIDTTGDALLILEAARRGLIPRVTRRLVDSERKMITSGSVFVFDEEESGIKRWTDGFFWSPSRILGNFLLYRETDKRGAGHRGARSADASDDYGSEVSKPEGQTLSRPKAEATSGIDKQRERHLRGSLTNSYKFKSDGLMKKTFSLNINGVAQHLISYYRVEDVENGRLRSPSSLPELASLDISPEYLDKTHFRNPPKVEIDANGVPRYRGEADDVDTSPRLLSAPLSTGIPLGRGKRYEPYTAQVPGQKRTRPMVKEQTRSPEALSPTDQLPSQAPSSSSPRLPAASYNEVASSSHHPAPAAYPYPNVYQAPAGYPPHPPYPSYAGPSGGSTPSVPHHPPSSSSHHAGSSRHHPSSSGSPTYTSYSTPYPISQSGSNSSSPAINRNHSSSPTQPRRQIQPLPHRSQEEQPASQHPQSNQQPTQGPSYYSYYPTNNSSYTPYPVQAPAHTTAWTYPAGYASPQQGVVHTSSNVRTNVTGKGGLSDGDGD